MNAAELRSKSISELSSTLEDLLGEQFRNRMALRSGQLPQTHLMRALRRDIARVKTIIREKRAGEQA